MSITGSNGKIRSDSCPKVTRCRACQEASVAQFAAKCPHCGASDPGACWLSPGFGTAITCAGLFVSGFANRPIELLILWLSACCLGLATGIALVLGILKFYEIRKANGSVAFCFGILCFVLIACAMSLKIKHMLF